MQTSPGGACGGRQTHTHTYSLDHGSCLSLLPQQNLLFPGHTTISNSPEAGSSASWAVFLSQAQSLGRCSQPHGQQNQLSHSPGTFPGSPAPALRDRADQGGAQGPSAGPGGRCTSPTSRTWPPLVMTKRFPPRSSPGKGPRWLPTGTMMPGAARSKPIIGESSSWERKPPPCFVLFCFALK